MNPLKLTGLLAYSAFAPGDGSIMIDVKKNSPKYKQLSFLEKCLEAISWNNYTNQEFQADKSGFKHFVLRLFLGKEASHKLSIIKSSQIKKEKQIEGTSFIQSRFEIYKSFYYQNFTLSPMLVNRWRAKDDELVNSSGGINFHWSLYINPLAFLNPLNYWRAIDTFFSTTALWCFAASDDNTKNSSGKAWSFYTLGLIFSLITAVFRWPRVGLQFMIGLSVRPLWHCIRRLINHDNPGLGTWLLATALTVGNIVLLGLPNAAFTLANFIATTFFNAPLDSLAARFLQNVGFESLNQVGGEVCNLDNVDHAVDNTLKPLSNLFEEVTSSVFGSPLNYAATGANTATSEIISENIANMAVAESALISTSAVRATALHAYHHYQLKGANKGQNDNQKENNDSDSSEYMYDSFEYK